MANVLGYLGAFGFFIVSLLIAGIWVLGSMALAPAQRSVQAPPAFLNAEPVTLTRDGAPDLAGWRIPEQAPLCGVVALFHGRGAARDQMLTRAILLAEAGFAVVLFDFQGHGESGGDIIGFGRREAEDVRRVAAEARAFRPGAPFGVLGLSLGAAAAMEASEDIDARVYVLEAMYSTLLETTAMRMPFTFGRRTQAWVAHLLTPIRLGYWASTLRPIDRLAALRVPALIMGGGADPVATPEQSQALLDASNGPTRLIMIEGAGHEDFLARDPRTWTSAVIPFLRDGLCPQATASVQSDTARIY